MIKLNKGAEPEVLSRQKADWTADLLRALQDEDRDTISRLTRRYNHPEIKAALKLETRGKCAYCEARVTDVAHGDIEHVTPKSISRELTFDWNNLTFSCQICNNNKANKQNIIDPYSDEPDQHLFFAGPFAKGLSPEGARTVLELKLNRVSLLESRNREIERYADQIEKIYLVQDVRTKELLLKAILEELDGGLPEFIAACRSVVLGHK